jgi:membrane-bound lytic murein transglycosylase F
MNIASESPRSRLVIALAGAALLASCAPPPVNKLDAVKQSGRLVMLTRNSGTTYYEGPAGPTGFEYEMAKMFADRIGVRLKVVVPKSLAEMIPLVAQGGADFAAAGLTITPARAAIVNFSPPYQQIREQVVYRAGTLPPRSAADLPGRQIAVVRGASYEETLAALKERHPALTWSADNTDTEELLERVNAGTLDLTISDSNIIAMNRGHNPEIQVAFDISEPRLLAWAFPKSGDASLYNEAAAFMNEMRASGKLAQLIERHFGAAPRISPINVAAFRERIAEALPFYRRQFELAAAAHQIDWRLLAAVAYQESYWDPQALSPTGVRGMMMLTRATADSLGVSDRTDVQQSLHAGARYLRYVINRVPARIQEPDRTWMALAAYNVGLNHLNDARIIAQQTGRNADRWTGVRESLPLLTQQQWFEQVKFGYARGHEPVQFVARVRTYYEILRSLDAAERRAPSHEALELRAPAI